MKNSIKYTLAILLSISCITLFADEDPYATVNWSLQTSSPLIDAGNNTVNSTILDLGGYPRVVDGTIDIGAYEVKAQITGIANEKKIIENSFYPNPAANKITHNGEKLSIYSFTGVLILSKTDQTVDISQLAQGQYIIKIEQENRISHSILIKK